MVGGEPVFMHVKKKRENELKHAKKRGISSVRIQVFLLDPPNWF